MLKTLKQTTLQALKASGTFRLVAHSQWRRSRLLILAYHGISLADEHEWNGALYMSPDLFRARLELIRDFGCTVLPLGEALQRLRAGDLPPKSVAITFDDGTYDFSQEAYPLLREFGFPVTLYLTTFYCDYNRPVFDVMCSYLLWKGRAAKIDLKQLTGENVRLSLSDPSERQTALDRLQRFARDQKYTAVAKDELATSLARELKVDYDAVLEKRMLHLLRPDEVKQLAANGVEVQLHTHRHRAPLERELFLREIHDNRKSIEAMTGKSPTHFCYPSGIHHPLLAQWLRETGIESATTCDSGLASPESDSFLLPRLLDGCGRSPNNFAGWLSGVSAALPNGDPGSATHSIQVETT
jgi:hypothetical protein